MNAIIYNYILQAVLGCASGYITNDYAINMLFKEYTPLKIGGVIKKTRNEFIDNLSSLVENDIINKNKLIKILTDDEFKIKFEQLTEDFFENCLYDVSGNDVLADINGLNSSIQTTKEFLEKNLNKHMEEITASLFNDIKLNDFLNDTQLNKITDSLFESVINTVKNTNIIEEELLFLYSEKGNIKLNDICSKDKINIVTNGIITKLNHVIKNDFTEKTEETLKDVFKAVQFDKAFTSSKNIFYDKTLNDIVKIDEEFKDKTTQIFLNYINSSAGQNTIYDLCESLMSYIKKSDKTLFDIIDSSFEINLKSYLTKNLPNVTENIVSWVKKNNHEIDKIIEDSVNEVIKESDPLKGKLLGTIKNSYLNNLSEKYNVVQKIINYIKQETEPDKLSNNLSSKIIGYLSDASIGELLTEAENNKMITSLKVTDYITNYLNNNSKTILNEIFNKILNLKVKDVMFDEVFSNDIIKQKITSSIKDKILSSTSINKSLSNKANNYLENYLDKNLNELFNEESLNKFIPNINDFILKSLNNNKDNVKISIVQEIKENINNLNINDLLKNNKNISATITNIIIKQYNDLAFGIKNKKLSEVFDKLNEIDNLNKNSSEMLRKLMINNIDTILSGSIKAIVYENLNKLSDDELVDFANDFIGRELQPIMYFGGILGLIAGLILAAIQNSPPNFGAVTLANMFTCALVGFLTNVIAIDMIFKPYKEIKILSKIPFLRNFSLGYIVKNKKVFAENTAHFVDNNLLSRESINELFDKYELKIKDGMTKSIAEDNYSVFHKLLNNNQNNIVYGSYNFTKSLIDKNINNISSFIVNKTDDIEFSSILSPDAINYLCSLGMGKQLYLSEKASEFIYSKINSGKSLDRLIPNSLTDNLKNSIHNVLEKYYDKTSKNIKDIDYDKNFIMSYDGKYQNIIDKNLNEIFKNDEIKIFGKFISQYITDMILSDDWRKKAKVSASKLISKYFDKDETFGEIFGGKIKDYIDGKMPSLFDKLSLSVKNNIIKSKPKVSIAVQSEIKNSLGFIEKSMYTLMGGSEIVDDLINKIMTVKMPQFIDNKKGELNEIFSASISGFYNVKVENLKSNINKEQISIMIDSYFSNEKNAEFIERKVNSTVLSIEKKLENINAKNILKYISLDSLDSFFKCYEKEFNELFTELSNNMNTNKNIAINKIMILLNEIVDDFITTASFKDIFKEISKDDVKVIINNLNVILNKDDFLKNSMIKFINSYKEFTNENKVSEFINKDIFKKSTEKFIKEKLLKSGETELSLKNLYSSIIKEAADNNFNFIHNDTKAYAVNTFVESSVKSTRRNLDKILKAVKFDKIAQEEIEVMEPKKIHEMFNSFMDKYFTRLKIYGFWGFVFGINAYIGLSLTGLKIIGETFNRHKKMR